MLIRITAAALLFFAAPAFAIDEEHFVKASAMITKASNWLRSQQDSATGGWSVNPQPDSPQLPAITGLVLNGLLMSPGVDATDPAVRRGVEFILKYRQPDGGIYDRILPSYNTAICLSALARVRAPDAAAAIVPGRDFLTSLQWSEDSLNDRNRETGKVERIHPFYGGVGYGNSSRPDNSNLAMFLQALRDTGLNKEDPAFARAVVFLERTQMLDSVNDMPYADGSTQGGFIYATTPDGKPENLSGGGVGESKAGTIEETLSDGTKASRLRSYGSMTYAGFKGYVYADLKRDDPRVKAAYDWLRRNYTLKENPGIGTDGQYYYYVTFARALRAWGTTTITTLSADGKPAETRDWANDLIAHLETMQNQDGSFKSVDDRWMENNPVLITAYALIALQEAAE
ncbi:MAG: prenyltransferase/squalene oxidase repeat-containing protein [Phycisphaerales bacterium]